MLGNTACSRNFGSLRCPASRHGVPKSKGGEEDRSEQFRSGDSHAR
jgi:hypothetical protein